MTDMTPPRPATVRKMASIPVTQLPASAWQPRSKSRAAAPQTSPGDLAEPGKKGVAPVFVNAPALATQAGAMGTRYDFNEGCRVTLPAGDWHVRLSDIETGNILFDTTSSGGVVSSAKKYYVPFRIEIDAGGKRVFEHRYDASNRAVLIQFPVGTLGDIIAWFPYAVKFQQKHGCLLTVSMSPLLIPLFAGRYPHIRFVAPDTVQATQYYASYRLGLFFDDDSNVLQPSDFRLVGLHRTAAGILGVDPADARPLIQIENDTRPLPEKYVCIAAQSSTQCKYWNNPTGWREVVQFLKDHGYRVICIDQKPVHGTGMVWNHIPYGSEDYTGDHSLSERARWLRHADFFIGLSSGLSWLAWAVATPVVMISGFTHPDNEFETPYRIANFHTCNSCWNDVRVRFDHHDFLWCPRHAGTDRQFECTRLITAHHVQETIRRIDGFGEQSRPPRALIPC